MAHFFLHHANLPQRGCLHWSSHVQHDNLGGLSKVGNFGRPRQFGRAVLCWYCMKLFFIRTSVGVINPEEAPPAFVEAWTRTIENHSSCRKHGRKHVFVESAPQVPPMVNECIRGCFRQWKVPSRSGGRGSGHGCSNNSDCWSVETASTLQ